VSQPHVSRKLNAVGPEVLAFWFSLNDGTHSIPEARHIQQRDSCLAQRRQSAQNDREGSVEGQKISQGKRCVFLMHKLCRRPKNRRRGKDRRHAAEQANSILQTRDGLVELFFPAVRLCPKRKCTL